MTVNKIFKKGVFQVVGLLLLTLGVTGIIATGVGASPLDAFNVFIVSLTGISNGLASFLTNVSLAAFIFVFTRNFKLAYGIIVAVLMGVFIDIWFKFFGIFNINVITDMTFKTINGVVIAYLIAAISLVILAFGAAVLIVSKSVLSPYDEMSMFLESKVHNYTKAKVMLDGFFLVAAIVLGLFTDILLEQVNVFTFIIVIGLGPVINMFIKILRKR